MSYRVECDVAVDAVSTPGEAWKLMVDYMSMVFPHGRRAFARFVGPSDAEAVLRLDVEADAGRAAVTWLPDGSFGSDNGVPPYHVPLSICESSDDDPVSIPADRAVVTPGAALKARAGSRPISPGLAHAEPSLTDLQCHDGRYRHTSITLGECKATWRCCGLID